MSAGTTKAGKTGKAEKADKPEKADTAEKAVKTPKVAKAPKAAKVARAEPADTAEPSANAAPAAKVAKAATNATIGPAVRPSERLMALLIAPHVSEKAARATEKTNQYVFRVLRDATKPEIRAAVQLMFAVEVEGVQVVNVAGKEKRFGRATGRRSDWKKAYVSLKAGQSIDFTGIAKP